MMLPETSASFCKCHIPKNKNIHINLCENLKSYSALCLKIVSGSQIKTEANVPLSGKLTGSIPQFISIKYTPTYIKI